MIAGVVASQITQTGPAWEPTTNSSFNGTVSVYTDDFSDAAITALVTDIAPPQNYSLGYIMRVQVYDTGFSFMGTVYRIRV